LSPDSYITGKIVVLAVAVGRMVSGVRRMNEVNAVGPGWYWDG